MIDLISSQSLKSKDRAYPSTSVQLLFAISFSVISSTATLTEEGLWALQSFIASSSSNCTNSECSKNINLSIFEYELIFTSSSWTSVVVIITSGILIDCLGMPASFLIFSIIGLFGAALRVVSSYFVFHHLLTVLCITIGHVLVSGSALGLTAVRYYSGVWYFAPEYSAHVAGLYQSFGKFGALLAFVLVPQFGLAYRLEATLWMLAGSSVITTIISVMIFILSKLSAELKHVDSVNHEKQKNDDIRTLWYDAATFKKIACLFPSDFWLVVIATAVARACNDAVFMNSMGILTTLDHRTLFNASFIVSLSVLITIFVHFLLSFLINFAKFNVVFGFVGASSVFACEMMLSFVRGSPLPIFIAFSISTSIVVVSLLPMMADFVPNKFMGVAVSLTFILSNILNGTLTLIIGIVFQFGNILGGNTEKWFLATELIAAVGVVSVMCLFVLMFRDTRHWSLERCQNLCKVKDGETQHLSPRADPLEENSSEIR